MQNMFYTFLSCITSHFIFLSHLPNGSMVYIYNLFEKRKSMERTKEIDFSFCELRGNYSI